MNKQRTARFDRSARWRRVFSVPALAAALALAVALPVLVSGCHFLPREEDALPPPLIVPEEITYQTITVRRGSIVRSFRESARIASGREETVQFTAVSGRLAGIEAAVGDTVAAGQLLASLIIGDIEDSIETGALEFRKVEIGYLQVRERYDAGQVTALDLEKASIDLELARIRLERLERQLEQSRLYAPFAGRVVYAANLGYNDRVELYQPIVKVADMEDLLIRYSGENYKYLVPGTPLMVMVAREVYAATVVASGVDAPEGSADMKDTVWIRTDQPLPETTILGSTVYFEYELERSDDTIVIEKRLMNSVGGRKYVNVLVDGLRVERDVVTGLETNTEIEILSGLTVGDLLIDR